LLDLRATLGTWANIRPVRPHPALRDASPLRPERLEGVDILFVRELTGGLYFGEKSSSEDRASDECVYTRAEIERVVRRACEFARERDSRVTSVDKANVLETSRLWRRVTQEVVDREFPDITLEHVLVDAMAMYLLSRAADFDVIVTENMFGDILTDEASMLTGSLGMLPSASVGDFGDNGTGLGMYEPIHGSAPDIAGQGIANPLGMILCVAQLLRLSCGLEDEAQAIEAAVASAIADGLRTADIAAPGDPSLSTIEMADAVIGRIGE
jgi:3-isopropylmalate dehydrogenase